MTYIFAPAQMQETYSSGSVGNGNKHYSYIQINNNLIIDR